MGFPEFYEREKVGTIFRPNVRQVIESAAAYGVKPASADDRRMLLLLVDPQIDFVHEDGTLSVPGAVDDTRRVIEWLYKNVEHITDIAISLDSHGPIHIFYPGWWLDESEKHPEAMTLITDSDVDAGRWRPVYEEEWSHSYVHQLENRAKKTLMIWPYHTMLGTVGHAITPALYEAITFHSEARRSVPTYVIKGRIPKTEHYSLLEPEIKVPEHPDGDLNKAFLDRLATFDLIYVAGQAKSHCVLETVTSIVNHSASKSDLVPSLRLLNDCMSSVAHPDVDFDAMADERFDAFAKEGLTRVTSQDELG